MDALLAYVSPAAAGLAMAVVTELRTLREQHAALVTALEEIATRRQDDKGGVELEDLTGSSLNAALLESGNATVYTR